MRPPLDQCEMCPNAHRRSALPEGPGGFGLPPAGSRAGNVVIH